MVPQMKTTEPLERPRGTGKLANRLAGPSLDEDSGGTASPDRYSRWTMALKAKALALFRLNVTSTCCSIATSVDGRLTEDEDASAAEISSDSGFPKIVGAIREMRQKTTAQCLSFLCMA